MIGQCLSNKNENAIVSKSNNFLDLNKALRKGFPPKLENVMTIQDLPISFIDESTHKKKIPVRNIG